MSTRRHPCTRGGRGERGAAGAAGEVGHARRRVQRPAPVHGGDDFGGDRCDALADAPRIDRRTRSSGMTSPQACHDCVVASLAGYPVTAPPLPRPVVIAQHWADLTFIHWPVRPESVAHLYPPGTRPDVFADGLTYAGLVPFTMRRTALGTVLPAPVLRHLPRDQHPAVLDRRRRPPRRGVPVAGNGPPGGRARCPRRTRCPVYLGENAHHHAPATASRMKANAGGHGVACAAG